MEGEGVGQDVSAESSPAAESVETTSQATSQPGSQPNGQAPAAQQSVPYARFQQVIREVQNLRGLGAQVPQLQQQLKEATDKLAAFEKKQSQGTASPEDRVQAEMATQALENLILGNPAMLDRVVRAHPVLAKLMDNADALTSMQSGVQQMQQQQTRSSIQQVQTRVAALAKEAGLPATPQYLQNLYQMVILNAHRIPDGNARFAQGDLSVIDEAFKALQTDFLGQMQRANTQALLDTKHRTQSLPPAPRGGAAGPPGMPKIDKGTPNAVGKYFAELSKRAGQELAQGARQE